jgi:hypothetical protein
MAWWPSPPPLYETRSALLFLFFPSPEEEALHVDEEDVFGVAVGEDSLKRVEVNEIFLLGSTRDCHVIVEVFA